MTSNGQLEKTYSQSDSTGSGMDLTLWRIVRLTYQGQHWAGAESEKKQTDTHIIRKRATLFTYLLSRCALLFVYCRVETRESDVVEPA